MFAYCQNNPVYFKDSSGFFLCTAVGAIVGAAFGALEAVIDGKTGKEFEAYVWSGAVSGAVAGVAADILLVTGGSASVVVLTMAGAGALGSLAGAVTASSITGEELDPVETVNDMLFDAATGALFGYMGGAITSNLNKITTKGFFQAAKTIFKNEVDDLGALFAEEVLGNVTAGIARFLGTVFVDMGQDFITMCK